MRNLYNEVMEYCNPEDIDFVAIIPQYDFKGEPVHIDPGWFLGQAKRIDYDGGFGGEVINTGLCIVLKDGSWLERHVYDGSERFEYKQTPQKPDQESTEFSILFDRPMDSLPLTNPIIIDGNIVQRRRKN